MTEKESNKLVNKYNVKDITTESIKYNISDHSKRASLPFLSRKDINRDSGSSKGCLAFHFSTYFFCYNINFINKIQLFVFH